LMSHYSGPGILMSSFPSISLKIKKNVIKKLSL
jgi:hypothetical protein